MPNELSQTVEAALSSLLVEIETGRIEVYQNVLGQPYIIFRVPERPGGGFFLFHQDVRAWIAEFAWDGKHGLLRERDLDRILTFLRGRAMRKRLPQISDPAMLHLLRSEPVIAVVYEFMYEHATGRHEDTMEPLWKAWKVFAQERGLLRLGRKRFPGGSQVLSRLLTHFKETLLALGIAIEIKRSDGSNVTLQRSSDAPAPQSSSEACGSNPGSDKPLGAVDDKTAQIARLRELKAIQTQVGERRTP